MARVAVFLVLAVAAIAQASIPTNNAQGAVQVPRRQPTFDQKAKPLCKECEKIVTALKKVVENPETEQKLRDALTKICDIPLLSAYKERCMNMVNNVVVVIHELQSLFDNPTQFCDTIKLCDAQTPGMNSVSKKMLLAIVGKAVQDARQQTSVNIDACGLCTSALEELKRMLQIPQIIEKIQNETEKVCKYFGKYQHTCEQVVGDYVPKLLQILEDALCQPQETCAALHLCKQSVQQYYNQLRLTMPVEHSKLDRFLANVSSIQTVRGLNVGCLACKTGVEAALKILSRDSVVSTLATDITDLVCKILPDSIRPGCYDFLGIYGKAALQLTIAEWTPAQICTAVKACKSSSVDIFENLSVAEKGKVACDACKALSKTLAYELQQPGLQQDIITFLTRGCLHLPGKYANKIRCQSYVETYMPYMLDDIVAVSLVPEICGVVHLC